MATDKDIGYLVNDYKVSNGSKQNGTVYGAGIFAAIKNLLYLCSVSSP